MAWSTSADLSIAVPTSLARAHPPIPGDAVQHTEEQHRDCVILPELMWALAGGVSSVALGEPNMQTTSERLYLAHLRII
jgi:hypothetical protein